MKIVGMLAFMAVLLIFLSHWFSSVEDKKEDGAHVHVEITKDKPKTEVEDKIDLKRPFVAERSKVEAKDEKVTVSVKEGEIITASGLKYVVLRRGTGVSPTMSDMVKVHYKGFLIDGREFDNSYKRGQELTFGLGSVIKGWSEALQLMKEGAKWEVTIPPELAYGEKGAGEMIPSNATLIFEIDLIKVIKKEVNDTVIKVTADYRLLEQEYIVLKKKLGEAHVTEALLIEVNDVKRKMGATMVQITDCMGQFDLNETQNKQLSSYSENVEKWKRSLATYLFKNR